MAAAGASAGRVAAAAPTATAAPGATAAPVVAERRLVSVLFADLVGFTTLAEDRDAEEVRDLLSRYFELARGIVERHGGTIEKFIGDAVMAVWGTPTSHEDDAERAVRAALELVAGVRGLGTVRPGPGRRPDRRGGRHDRRRRRGDGRRRHGQHREPPPGCRAGRRRARRRGDDERRLAGHRVRGGRRAAPQGQGRARAGVAGAARRRGARRARAGRRRSRRRSSAATTSCACSRTSTTPRRATAESGSSRSPGRAASARAGSPGSSSSTSTGSSRRSTGTRAAPRPTAAGSPSGRWARWSASGPGWPRPTTRRRRGPGSPRPWLDGFPTSASDAGSRPRSWPSSAWASRRPAGRTSSSRPGGRSSSGSPPTRPVVMVFEDLQWADSGLLVVRRPPGRVEPRRPDLRRGAGPPGAPRDAPRLGRRQAQLHEPRARAARRRRRCTSSSPAWCPGFPTTRRGAIVARADGVPLYAVEIVRMLVAQGSLEAAGGVYRPVGDLADLAVPETLHSLIAARLDALDPADRALLQAAAVLGHSFTVDGLAAVAALRSRRRGAPTGRARPPRAGRPRPGSAVDRARPVRVRPVARPRGRLLDPRPARPQGAPPGRRPPLRDARRPGAGGRPRDALPGGLPQRRRGPGGRRARRPGPDRAPRGRRPGGDAGRPGAGVSASSGTRSR